MIRAIPQIFLAVSLVAAAGVLASDQTEAVPAMTRPAPLSLAVKLQETDRYRVSRSGKHLFVELKHPHRVLSTSDVNGGQTESLRYLVNFQSLEPAGHNERFEKIIDLSPAAYHQQLAEDLSVRGALMASMGTAASINNTAYVSKRFRDISVDAYATAGVRGNALRAGDRASWYQGEQGNEFVKDHGTINIILLINRTLTAGALAKAAMVVTEAKSAALAELAIPSTRSRYLATGTGTDQYIIAAPTESELSALDSASGHLKLGELIGSAVKDAVLEAIELQNGLSAAATRNIFHALGRFGLTEEELVAQVVNAVGDSDAKLFSDNKEALFNDAKLVAAAYAYAALLDRIEFGVLTNNIQADVLIDQAVNAAIAVSADGHYANDFRSNLVFDNRDPLGAFVQAIAIGWQKKWR
ncbi:MAG: adenosylcobinamide amidohydrolase [Pseudomonadota bacterium]